ncbi:hypothetical protein O181_052357 [Austropuccinia psidii MF-1]|uniref:Uncharacterized protein n=1 Tax=Austropuccinia psidii MF-1 TaxID=1389203 RepID=A0A9Q3E7H3_9BASI|nr:hypothetical protein [Austropuccinia psidii MF-1]
MEGAEPSNSSRLGEAEDEEGEESVEEEDFNKTEVAYALEDSPEVPNLSLSNQPLASEAEQNLLKMMEKMTQFLGELTQFSPVTLSESQNSSFHS